MVAADSFQSFLEGFPLTTRHYALALAFATVTLTALAVTPAARSQFTICMRWWEARVAQIVQLKWKLIYTVRTLQQHYYGLQKIVFDLFFRLLSLVTKLANLFLSFLNHLRHLWPLIECIYNSFLTNPYRVLAMAALLGFATYRTLVPLIQYTIIIITSITDIYTAFISATKTLYAIMQWLTWIVALCWPIVVFACVYLCWPLLKKKMATFHNQIPTWIKAKYIACPTSVQEQSTAWGRTVAEELPVDTPSLWSSERSLDPWSTPTQCMSEQPVDSLRTAIQPLFEQRMDFCPIVDPSSKRCFWLGDQAKVRRRRTMSSINISCI